MILQLLANKHNVWINYVKSFGCNKDIAEDYVQEMYIKIHTHVLKNGNELMYNGTEVNFYFIYVTLRNMFYDDCRKKKKITFEPINVDFENEITEYSEILFNAQLESKNIWLNNLNNNINNIKEYNTNKANLCYIKFIFDKVFVEQVSISKLSRDSRISYASLRNTVLLIKNQIKCG